MWSPQAAGGRSDYYRGAAMKLSKKAAVFTVTAAVSATGDVLKATSNGGPVLAVHGPSSGPSETWSFVTP
jgi:hypothetical protein